MLIALHMLLFATPSDSAAITESFREDADLVAGEYPSLWNPSH